ncbi:MAG: hypothetical protein ACI85F_001807 [Bacteroidia bacterium]|jgi:hypothetical protein
MITILRFRYLFSVLLFLFLINGLKALGQNAELSTFIGEVETGFTQSHEEALSSANLEQYRLRNSRRPFKFESGVSFELLSAVELTEAGYLVNPGEYLTQADLNPLVDFVFRLGPTNQLAIRSVIDPNSKLATIKVVPASNQNRISQSDLQQMSEEKRAYVLSNPNMFLIE